MANLTKEDLSNVKFIVTDSQKEKVKRRLEALEFDADSFENDTNLFIITSYSDCVGWMRNNQFVKFIKNSFKLITVDDIFGIPLSKTVYRPCKNIDEAKEFLNITVYRSERGRRIKYDIIGIDCDYFLLSTNSKTFKYITRDEAYRDFKTYSGEPVGIEEEEYS